MDEKELSLVLPTRARRAVIHLLLPWDTAHWARFRHLNEGLQDGSEPSSPPLPLQWLTNHSWLIPPFPDSRATTMGVQLQQWPYLRECVLLHKGRVFINTRSEKIKEKWSVSFSPHLSENQNNTLKSIMTWLFEYMQISTSFKFILGPQKFSFNLPHKGIHSIAFITVIQVLCQYLRKMPVPLIYYYFIKSGIYWVHSMHHSMLNISHILAHSILMKTLWVTYYYLHNLRRNWRHRGVKTTVKVICQQVKEPGFETMWSRFRVHAIKYYVLLPSYKW